MELADLFSLDLPREGVSSPDGSNVARALVVVMNQGKTNQHGRMEYGAALRHRDPKACLVGALAFWLFWRWQVEGIEHFPSLRNLLYSTEKEKGYGVVGMQTDDTLILANASFAEREEQEIKAANIQCKERKQLSPQQPRLSCTR